jgi:heptaprenyl diphosphate synthase
VVTGATARPLGFDLEAISHDELRAAAGGFQRDTTLNAACEYFLETRGKHLRSSIVLEAAKFGPEPDADRVRRGAIAVELLHFASLAHDDLIDDSTVRRGRRTVSTEFGHTAAAAVGAWLSARALFLVADCGVGAAEGLSEVACDACEGEMLEVEDLFDVDRTQARYLDAVRGKTARLFALAALAGAVLSRADEVVQSILRGYGEDLGLSFQISDDILDLVAGDDLTGKPPGGDLRQGVYTLPLIYAMEADGSIRDRLREGFAEDELHEIVDAVRATDGLERALADCERYAQAAIRGVDDLPENDGAKSRLKAIVEYNVARVRAAGIA